MDFLTKQRRAFFFFCFFLGKAYKINDMASKQSDSKSNIKFVVEILKNCPWEGSILQ